jgi:hypothetical protein
MSVSPEVFLPSHRSGAGVRWRGGRRRAAPVPTLGRSSSAPHVVLPRHERGGRGGARGSRPSRGATRPHSPDNTIALPWLHRVRVLAARRQPALKHPARASRSEAAAEGRTVLAVLLADITGFAAAAFVDGVLPGRPRRRKGERRVGGGLGLPGAPAGLAAGGRAPATPPGAGERLPAGRAGGSIVTVIVTRRHRRSRRPGCWRRPGGAGGAGRAGTGAGPAAGASRRRSW